MVSDGTPWRPLVHGLDIAKAIRCVLDGAASSWCTARCSTSDPSEQNYRVREIAEIVGEEFPGCDVTFGSTRRRQPQLPGLLRQDHQQAARFQLRLGRRGGARQLHAVFRRIDLDEDTFTGRGHTRLSSCNT